jgi:hypothetical protein
MENEKENKEIMERSRKPPESKKFVCPELNFERLTNLGSIFFEKGLPCFLLKAYKIGLIQQSKPETMLGTPAYKEELKLRKLQQTTTPPRKN